jgi:hypothetical protein
MPASTVRRILAADLEDLLARIERHEQKERTQQRKHDHQPAAPAAA